MNKKVYITTGIPYVNAAPHVGFALELAQADALARYYRSLHEEVRLVAGTDDNALKNVLAAEAAGLPTEQFVAKHRESFRALKATLNLATDDFISTREERHIRGAQKFWLSCAKDIYKKSYRGLYCVGCEEFKRETDLVDGRCPEHPKLTPETVEEENYFFRLSNYARELKNLLVSDELQIIPESRRGEMLKFIEAGLEDFSVSRPVARAKGWGIPVPGDPNQVMYVWFDALTNYLNILGYADDAPLFNDYWTDSRLILHCLGKGILRFHALYWPAMLISAGLRLPNQILVHGYVTLNGQKISKSLGNTIHPDSVVERYGVDALRYYLLREIAPHEDGDYSEEKMRDRYNGDLANGLGNFASRVTTLAAKLPELSGVVSLEIVAAIDEARAATATAMRVFRFHEALAAIWKLITFGDTYVNDRKPWEGSPERNAQVLFDLMILLQAVAELLWPFLPQTAEKIRETLRWSADKKSVRVSRIQNLFPRILA